MAAEVRELGVGLEADLALERLDAAVYVLVLLETARRGERLATVRTRVSAGAAEGVRRADVTLQVAGVRERLLTRVTDVRLLMLVMGMIRIMMKWKMLAS